MYTYWELATTGRKYAEEASGISGSVKRITRNRVDREYLLFSYHKNTHKRINNNNSIMEEWNYFKKAKNMVSGSNLPFNGTWDTKAGNIWRWEWLSGVSVYIKERNWEIWMYSACILFDDKSFSYVNWDKRYKYFEIYEILSWLLCTLF